MGDPTQSRFATKDEGPTTSEHINNKETATNRPFYPPDSPQLILSSGTACAVKNYQWMRQTLRGKQSVIDMSVAHRPNNHQQVVSCFNISASSNTSHDSEDEFAQFFGPDIEETNQPVPITAFPKQVDVVGQKDSIEVRPAPPACQTRPTLPRRGSNNVSRHDYNIQNVFRLDAIHSARSESITHSNEGVPGRVMSSSAAMCSGRELREERRAALCGASVAGALFVISAFHCVIAFTYAVFVGIVLALWGNRLIVYLLGITTTLYIVFNFVIVFTLTAGKLSLLSLTIPTAGFLVTAHLIGVGLCIAEICLRTLTPFTVRPKDAVSVYEIAVLSVIGSLAILNAALIPWQYRVIRSAQRTCFHSSSKWITSNVQTAATPASCTINFPPAMSYNQTGLSPVDIRVV